MNPDLVYESLRQELLNLYDREVKMVTFTFTVTAVLIGYGFASKNSLAFLLPVPILALLLVQLNNWLYTIFTISVYIRVYIEPEHSIPKGETDIGTLRDKLRKEKPFDELKNYNPLTVFAARLYADAAAGMGVICIILTLAYASLWYEYLVSGIVAVGWIIACLILFRPITFVNSGKYESELRPILEEQKRGPGTGNQVDSQK
jgi:hypothetical protein